MKKFLLSIVLFASLALSNQALAQCNNVIIQPDKSVNGTPVFNFNPTTRVVTYSYNYQFNGGNPSLNMTILCGTTLIYSNCHTRVNFNTYYVSGTLDLKTIPAYNSCSSTNITFSLIGNASSGCGGQTCPVQTFSTTVSNSTLPVSFKSFNANRNKSAVSLNWETSLESNNKGFEIQRKTSGNDYTTIAFVDTKAKGGNSESDLSYSFSDLNSYKGISQYRIRQVDFDGQSKYTEVRSVRGEEQSTAKNSVYPNPSNNGNVNVVFEDVKSIRDIQLMDMNGRVVNQWRNYSNNNIKIENLTSGFYSLRVVDQNTKEQSIEKIIVNRN